MKKNLRDNLDVLFVFSSSSALRLPYSVKCVVSDPLFIQGLCSNPSIVFWQVDPDILRLLSTFGGEHSWGSSQDHSCTMLMYEHGVSDWEGVVSPRQGQDQQIQEGDLCVGMDKGRDNLHGFCRHGSIYYCLCLTFYSLFARDCI